MWPVSLDGNAVYDILLRALTIKRCHTTDTSTQAIAYADDLLSVSSTLDSLQQQADLVAAFAAIFKLDQAHTKFRAYKFSYHRTHAQQQTGPLLILRVDNANIPLRQAGTLTHLGSQYDLDPKEQSQYNHHQPNLIDTFMPSAIAHPPSTAKSTSYKAPSSPALRTPVNSYLPRPFSCTSWIERSSNEADKSSDSPHISRRSPLQPTPRLSMPSDAIPTSQIRCFWRSTANGPLWAHTIAKIFADSGLFICKPPTAPTGPPSIISSYSMLAPATEQLHHHALTTVGNLHTGKQ
jgi:hypothetical protein